MRRSAPQNSSARARANGAATESTAARTAELTDVTSALVMAKRESDAS
jgi:hypothetical protein